MSDDLMAANEAAVENRYRLRLAVIIAVAVLGAFVAVSAAITIISVRAAQRDQAVRVACVTAGEDYYPQDGGKCVHAGGAKQG